MSSNGTSESTTPTESTGNCSTHNTSPDTSSSSQRSMDAMHDKGIDKDQAQAQGEGEVRPGKFKVVFYRDDRGKLCGTHVPDLASGKNKVDHDLEEKKFIWFLTKRVQAARRIRMEKKAEEESARSTNEKDENTRLDRSPGFHH